MLLHKELESRFTEDEIEAIIQNKLKKFNPFASGPTPVNGSIGCACNKLVNDDTCPIIEVDPTDVTIADLSYWSVKVNEKEMLLPV